MDHVRVEDFEDCPPDSSLFASVHQLNILLESKGLI